MQDIMIDLETLGQTPGCVILSIGAVEFGAGGLGREFYAVLNTSSCEALGLHRDADTERWWNAQGEEAQRVLGEAAEGGDHAKYALQALNRFIFDNPARDVKIWGNGADFDNAILACAYRAAGLKPGWKFWNNRCFRTLKAQGPRSAEPARQGVYHHALDDAKHQARWAIELSESHGVRVFV